MTTPLRPRTGHVARKYEARAALATPAGFLHVVARYDDVRVVWQFVDTDRAGNARSNEHTFDIYLKDSGWSRNNAQVNWAAWGSQDPDTTRNLAIALRLCALVGEVADNGGITAASWR